MNRSSSQAAMATIDAFINSVGGQVKAADGSKPLSEPGSIGGETSHPVKNVDDRLESKPEGERFKENTKDVKEDQGKPSVENAAEAKASGGSGSTVTRKSSPEGASAKTAASVFDVAASLARGRHKQAEGGAVSQPGSAEDDTTKSVLKVAPTGEDPKSETDSAKSGKTDPGSSHPARTDNTSLDGHKWAADDSLEKLASAMKEVGDSLCAQVAWISQQQGAQKTAAAAQAVGGVPPQAPPQAQQQKQAEVDPELARQAGWELAGLINGTMDKRAADAMVRETMFQVIKQAAQDADNYIAFRRTFDKQAEGDEAPEGDKGGAPAGGADPSQTGGGADPQAMMAALGGGAAAGGAGGMGGMGGAGGPPMATDGGSPATGGGGSEDQEAQQLAMILEQLNITPEELQQELAQLAAQGGGAGGPAGPGAGDPSGGAAGGAGGAGGAAMPAAGGGGGGMETQASDRGGKPQEKAAAMAQYISEIIQRSRARRR